MRGFYAVVDTADETLVSSLIEGGATLVVKRMAREFTERLAERCAGPAQSTC